MEDRFEYLTELPNDFQERIQGLEAKITNSCEISDIKAIVSLYSVRYIQLAIEYYESINDQKYISYYKQLHCLLLKDYVQSALNSAARPQRKPLSSITTNTEVKVAEMCETPKDNPANNIKKQEDAVQEKLNARRLHKRNSFKSKSEFDWGIDRDVYENELVDLMEGFLTEKIMRVNKIKGTYEQEIEEIRSMGDFSVFSDVIKQMEVNMQLEIEEVIKEVDDKKLREINALKEKRIFS